ncbi:hypothetical protein [Brucella pseudintermedia]|uniref:hypothetical protein n=1 Tax=Brucella pseudintermedia TaxID=370111 RepID=UPI00142EA7F9|nr:hypothetical protein [Brucella pseudintermedia]
MKELFNSPYFGQFCVMVASITLMLGAMNLYWAMKKVVTLWEDLRESLKRTSK